MFAKPKTATSAIVRTLPYPAIEDGNCSFDDGKYEPCIKIGHITELGGTVSIEHNISGAPLIERLISEGRVAFACLLSIPKAGYRKLCTTDKKEQSVSWSAEFAAELPTIRPLLIYKGVALEHLLTKECGVAELWRGKKITIHKGARLAQGSYFRIDTGSRNLIRPVLKKEFQGSEFTVKPNQEEGFYFTVEASESIFKLLQAAGGAKNKRLRKSILTMVVSHCFEILAKDYTEPSEEAGESPLDTYSNLRHLSEDIKEKLKHDWNDEKFDSVWAATHLYPVIFDEKDDADEDE